MHFFEKMSQSALNHVLILQKDRTQKMLQIPLKIIDLQNDFNILVAKQWKIRISVPMSYIMCFYALTTTDKKTFWWSWLEHIFDRPHKYTKGNSGGHKVFNQSFGLIFLGFEQFKM